MYDESERLQRVVAMASSKVMGLGAGKERLRVKAWRASKM